jgi:hypothetical protein
MIPPIGVFSCIQEQVVVEESRSQYSHFLTASVAAGRIAETTPGAEGRAFKSCSSTSSIRMPSLVLGGLRCVVAASLGLPHKTEPTHGHLASGVE